VSVAALSTEARGDAAPEVDHARRTLQDHKELASTILQTAAPCLSVGWALFLGNTYCPHLDAKRPSRAATLPGIIRKGLLPSRPRHVLGVHAVQRQRWPAAVLVWPLEVQLVLQEPKHHSRPVVPREVEPNSEGLAPPNEVNHSPLFPTRDFRAGNLVDRAAYTNRKLHAYFLREANKNFFTPSLRTLGCKHLQRCASPSDPSLESTRDGASPLPAKMRRVLKPGGKLLFVKHGRSRDAAIERGKIESTRSGGWSPVDAT
jgi:hypothetical protein